MPHGECGSCRCCRHVRSNVSPMKPGAQGDSFTLLEGLAARTIAAADTCACPCGAQPSLAHSPPLHATWATSKASQLKTFTGERNSTDSCETHAGALETAQGALQAMPTCTCRYCERWLPGAHGSLRLKLPRPAVAGTALGLFKSIAAMRVRSEMHFDCLVSCSYASSNTLFAAATCAAGSPAAPPGGHLRGHLPHLRGSCPRETPLHPLHGRVQVSQRAQHVRIHPDAPLCTVLSACCCCCSRPMHQSSAWREACWGLPRRHLVAEVCQHRLHRP